MTARATPPYVREQDITQHVGSAAAQRARPYSRDGSISGLTWDEDEGDEDAAGTLSGTVHGTSTVPYRTRITLRSADPVGAGPGPAGVRRFLPVRSLCSCPVRDRCKHAAALMYRSTMDAMRSTLSGAGPAQDTRTPAGQLPPARPAEAEWRRTLAPLLGSQTRPDAVPLAIGVELLPVRRWHGYSHLAAEHAAPADLGSGVPLTVVLRPLRAGKRENWIKGGLSWNRFLYSSAGSEFVPEQARWLTRLVRLHRAGQPFASDPGERLRLDELTSAEGWALLRDLDRAGIPLVGAGSVEAVTWGPPAHARLDVHADGEDLRVTAKVTADDRRHEELRPTGPGGFFRAVPGTRPTTVALELLPASQPVPETVQTLMERPEPLRIPAADAPEFLADLVPQMRDVVDVTSQDGSVEFPAPQPPQLLLSLEHGPGQGVQLRWSWRYSAPSRILPLHRAVGAPGRDANHEDAVLAAVRELWPCGDGTDQQELVDAEAAVFIDQILPRLEALEHLTVHEHGTRPDHTELRGTPALRIRQREEPGRRDPDWFDLGFEITLGDVPVSFAAVFTALSRGREAVLMPDRSYFRLDHPTFDALRELIAEGQAMAEWEPEVQRISRHQVTLWEELEDLAEHTEQAQAWAASVGALGRISHLPSPAPPTGLEAELRPYQHEGYAWLSLLYDHRLGGVLADDMGLGKTLQTLALIVRARSFEPDAPPFLVVAPASVLPVWAAEAERFAPGLDLRVLDATAARRGQSVAEAARGADVVVTSYTVLRLDDQQFQEPEWDGVVLDEAQFVKNRATKAHRAARNLRTRFRLAITGTPLENSLTDLWSLLALTVPGLFPSPRTFREEYVKPVEQPDDSDSGRRRAGERLDRLRRRIRPFMLRRSKELVASDLPEKQEQVVRVPLEPAHRRLYDRILQRERQKLLRLVEDMDSNRFVVFRSLTLLRMLALDPAIVAEEHREVPSSKLRALLASLEEVVADQHRVIVFSQFTSHLARIAEELRERGIQHSYLDGTTRERRGAVEAFRGGNAPVFLISLKAGGFGLTLTEADYVFLMDPWWNPAVEAQAIDRAHRIGQTRRVMVYRMVAEDTIEEKVLALQERKAQLLSSVTDGGQAFSSALSADDVRALLRQE